MGILMRGGSATARGRLAALLPLLLVGLAAPAARADAPTVAPRIDGPPAAGNTATPKVFGVADDAAGDVHVYTNADCSGPAAASGSVQDFASGIAVPVTPNAQTTFSANQSDTGNTALSPCSTAVTYTEDEIRPALSNLSLSSGGPANDNAPRLHGHTDDPGATIRVYTNGDTCSGTPAFTGTGAALNGAGIPLHVRDDTTTTFTPGAVDTAGNVYCSRADLHYVEDSAPPAVPTALTFDPRSPAQATLPVLRGAADAGSTVRVYGSADCTGAPVFTGPAGTFTGSHLAVFVPAGATRSFSATATDAVGNTSRCSAPAAYTALPAPKPPTRIPSAKAVLAALTKALPPTGKGARIAAILRARFYRARFTAPSAGTVTISWYQVPRGAHVARAKQPILVATGTRKIAKKGKTTIKIKLTRAGRVVFRKVKKGHRLRLTAKGTFTPKGGRRRTKKQAISVKR